MLLVLMKNTATNLTAAEFKIPARAVSVKPALLEFIRLPAPKERCPLTGLSRGALNDLILPCPKNGFNPPVKSFCIRQRGAKTGIRIIDFQSLRRFILAHEDTTATAQNS